ncbi:amidase [Rhizobium etli]|uniref:amidase n=1 Tax=Rhizobium etli TaxID=29449 RepID=UPI0003839A67|nr:amidase [Rhizobium etli]AGS24478.1 amidase protein [Rhizobium etli bv. mimosae str. Mim1]
MNLREYMEFDATELGSLVNAGEVTPSELAQLARIATEGLNPQINAIIEFYDDAESVSGAADGPFHGVPFLRKDLGATESGRLQERGSRLFKGYRADSDSYFFSRARDAGLRTVGRTAPTEFGSAGMSESTLCGVTRNPWALDRTAGGSSGGSAAAVAAGITPIAHGSDGGGSIRIPASWCGLVGLNPSACRISDGRPSDSPTIGFSREFILCRTVRDMAAGLDAFSDRLPTGPFGITAPIRPFVEELSQATGTLRVGIARTKWGESEVEPEILSAVEEIGLMLEAMGHKVIDVEAPYDPELKTRISIGRAPQVARSLEDEARALGRSIDAHTLEPINLKKFEFGRGRTFDGQELAENIRKIRLQVSSAIDGFDLLLTPTMPIFAPAHGSIYSTTNPTLSYKEFAEADTSLYQYLGIFNVTGHPSVSLPLAHSTSGLPIGIQLVARIGGEATLVRIARDLEEGLPWRQRRPSLS